MIRFRLRITNQYRLQAGEPVGRGYPYHVRYGEGTKTRPSLANSVPGTHHTLILASFFSTPTRGGPLETALRPGHINSRSTSLPSTVTLGRIGVSLHPVAGAPELLFVVR
jgi:hypothetical protein